jgi:hypothetical protein
MDTPVRVRYAQPHSASQDLRALDRGRPQSVAAGTDASHLWSSHHRHSDEVQILVGAFDKAWETVQATGVVYAVAKAEAVRTILAKHIIEAAKQGERDHARLRGSSAGFSCRSAAGPESEPNGHGLTRGSKELRHVDPPERH